MNFVFAADKNYLPHFETVLKSVMCYHENVHIFLFINEPLDEEFLQRIGYYMQKRNSRFFYYILSATDLAGLKNNGHITTTTYARYFINRLLPHQKDNRWCYLDIDTIVNGDLTHVFDLMQNPAQHSTAQHSKRILWHSCCQGRIALAA
ncbi:glycosyltransferase [Lonepinella sp. BR2357]|uniref:glycosyltransferase n=1 Tax=Lonepinella sp. BR2357 TaxID=3434549 RepID=UPI003F6E3DA5